MKPIYTDKDILSNFGWDRKKQFRLIEKSRKNGLPIGAKIIDGVLYYTMADYLQLLDTAGYAQIHNASTQETKVVEKSELHNYSKQWKRD